MIIVESQTQQGRMNGKNAIVDVLAKENIVATNSFTVFPPTEGIDKLNEDEIESRILAGSYDGVLVTSLVNAKSREVQKCRLTYYKPIPYRHIRHIRTDYVHMQKPEYYRQQTTSVLETRFLNVNDSATKESVVWSGQSELTDPSSAESTAKKYSKQFVKTLFESGTIKK